MLKIGFLHIGIPQDHPSGVTRYSNLLAQSLKEIDAISIQEVSLDFRPERKGNPSKLKKALRTLQGCDVLHLSFTAQMWDHLSIYQSFLLIYSELNTPFVLTLHDTTYLNYLKSPKKTYREKLKKLGRFFFFLYLCRRASSIILHSKSEKRHLKFRSIYEHKIRIIPHFAEERAMRMGANEAKRHLKLENGTVLTILGFIFPRKGFELAIRALALLPPNFTLVFAGGPSKGNEHFLKRLIKLAHDLGVIERLRITGFLSNEEQDQYMAATDIALAPNMFMSASGSLATWIAARKARILVARHAELELYERLVPGALNTFVPFTPNSLASAIISIDSNSVEEFQSALISRLKAKITLTQTGERYLQCFASACKNLLIQDFLPPTKKSLVETVQSKIEVSILIPVFNQRQNIPMLLATIEKLNFPRDQYEVIVIDNGSCDGTLEYLKTHEQIILVEERENRSSYAARNTGIRIAKGKILAFTDSDCTVDPNWLSEGVNAMKSQSLDLLSGMIARKFQSPIRALDLVDACTYLRNDLYYRQGVSATANTFIRRDAFQKIGLFPSKIKAGGDWIWTACATRAGLKIGYSNAAIVFHPTHSFFDLAKKIVRGGIAYQQIAETIDPSGSRFWRTIRQHLLLKSWKTTKNKFKHPEMSNVRFYLIKAWLLDSTLSTCKLLGISLGFFNLNRAKTEAKAIVTLNNSMASGNPYQTLFYDALAQHHFILEPTGKETTPARMLTLNTDIFHVHWTSALNTSTLACFFDLLSFTSVLLICKIRGIQIWWTAHNLLPHDSQHENYQFIKRFILVQFADLILVHHQNAKIELKKTFHINPKKIVHFTHGTYETIYPNVLSKEAARRKLHISSEKKVFIFFGRIRKYKNVESLILAFLSLEEKNCLLIIAGGCESPEEETTLKDLAKNDPRICFHTEHIKINEVQLFFNSADCVILPYQEIFTSGSALLAKTFGKFLITKDCSFMREYFTPTTALLAHFNTPTEIQEALHQFLNSTVLQSNSPVEIEKYSWQQAVKKLISEPKLSRWTEARKKAPLR